MPKGAPKDLSDCRKFFLEPDNPKQRMYEALRAYFVDDRSSSEVARAFGYTTGSFQVLCHHFRRDSDPVFFTSTRPGPRSQPKKSAARELIIELREAKSFGLRDQRSAEGTELSSQSNGGPGSPQGGRLRSASSAVRCRTSRSTPAHRRADCRCPESVSGSAHVHDSLWRLVLICSGFGASEVGSVGSEHPYARIQNDPGRTGIAELSGTQTLVHRTSQPCYGAGSRRRLGVVCRTECLSKEKLLVGIFLSR